MGKLLCDGRIIGVDFLSLKHISSPLFLGINVLQKIRAAQESYAFRNCLNFGYLEIKAMARIVNAESLSRFDGTAKELHDKFVMWVTEAG